MTSLSSISILFISNCVDKGKVLTHQYIAPDLIRWSLVESSTIFNPLPEPPIGGVGSTSWGYRSYGTFDNHHFLLSLITYRIEVTLVSIIESLVRCLTRYNTTHLILLRLLGTEHVGDVGPPVVLFTGGGGATGGVVERSGTLVRSWGPLRMSLFSRLTRALGPRLFMFLVPETMSPRLRRSVKLR